MARSESQSPPSPRAPRAQKFVQILLLSLGAGLLLWVVGSILYGVGSPIVRLVRADMEQRSLERQVAARKAERDSLVRQTEYARSPAGSEGIVRGQGMVKQGEHAFRFDVVPPAQAATAKTAPVASASTQRAIWGGLVALATIGCFLVVFRLRRRRRKRADGVLATRSELNKERGQ